MEVRNHQGQVLGIIEDLAVDPNTGRVSYVVLNAELVLEGRETFVAVPLTAFQPDPGQRHLTLQADRSQLQAEAFSYDQWPDLNDPNIQTGWGTAGAGMQSGRGQQGQFDR
jgi:hypothetical protein